MKYILSLLVVLSFTSCLKLDSNLYNNDTSITEYKLDNFTGEQDFILDSSYFISSQKITLLTLASQAPNESKATNIKAIYIGDVARIGIDTVILYCHGNKWHMDFYWQRAKLMAHTNGKHRYGVMYFDYRGYGLSEGAPTEEGLFADADACLQWLKDKGLVGERLIMYGFSLGSAPATELTATVRTLRPSKLILEAPFASSEVMVEDASLLNMPASYFTSTKINNADKIRNVSQPFFWMHGLNDNFLNYKTHGQVVYDNYGGNYKQKFMIPGADHGEVPEKAGFTTYLDSLGKFIRR